MKYLYHSLPDLIRTWLRILTLMSVLFTGCLFNRAHAQWVENIAITPSSPTTATPVTASIDYWLGNSCVGYTGYSVFYAGNSINIYMTFTFSNDPFCLQVVTPGTESVVLGNLSAGDYNVNVWNQTGTDFLGSTSFTVTGGCNVPTGFVSGYVHYSVLFLQWNAVSGATGYRTRIRAVGTSTWNESSVCDPSTNTYWYNATPNTTFEAQVRTCCSSGESAWSSSIFVTTLGSGDPYCYSYGSSELEWINSVSFGSINNTSGNNYGYRNYTNLSTSVTTGQSYPITVTPGNADTNDPINWRIWIDFNKDNDFNDAGELVVSAAGNDQSPLSTSITIPSSASTGNTRMRVMLAYSAITGPCDLYDLRDIEDYTINISSSSSCNTPTGLTATYIHYSTFSLQWNAVTGATGYRTRVKPVTSTTWIEDNICSPSTSLYWYNIIPNTNYEVQVKTCCSAGESGWSSSILFNTLGAGDPYCYSYGTSEYEWINSVSLGSINNTSGNNHGYRNYTNLSTSVQQGQSYPIVVVPGNADTNDNVSWYIWIDFNKDNDFNDAGENIVSATGNDQTPLSTLISIPVGSQVGSTRMRIMMAFSSITGPCDQVGFRDIEDYTIDIVAATSLSVSPNSLLFTATGGSNSINVSSNCTSWSVSGGASWLTVTPLSGTNNGLLNVSCTPNVSPQSRSTTLTISGCNLTQTVTVTQSGATASLLVSPGNISFTSNGGNNALTVTSNCGNWVVSGAPSWLTVSPTMGSQNGNITLTCATNTSTQTRTATITIIGCNITQTVTVTQSGATATLLVSPGNISFTSNGGNNTLAVTSNCDNWTVSGAPSWLTVSPTTGSQNGNITLTCATNTSTQTRTATLTISGCNLTQTVIVTQSGATASLLVSPGNISFTSNGGNNALAVTSNCDNWAVSGAPSWLTVSPTAGSQNGNITLTCATNTSTQTRTATLTISGCNLTQTVTVTQSGATATLIVSPLSLSFTNIGGSNSFMVTSNCGSWSVSGIPSWITVSPISGMLNEEVMVFCNTNTSTQPRNATLVVSGCNTIQNITISQSGVSTTLAVSPSTVNILSGGSTVSVNVNTNCDNWTVGNIPTWLTISPTIGSLDGVVQITAQPNTSPLLRSAEVVLTACGQTVVITVTQAGITVPWVVEQTGENHTIILPGNLISDINGMSLSPGDAVGLFYEEGGIYNCGGYGIWTGQNVSFPVFGNDAVAPQKNGFALNELFIVKIWKSLDNQEINAAATYMAPDGIVVTHTNMYANNGVSMISALTGNLNMTYSIPLTVGWNMISSYVNPSAPDMLTVFSGIASEVAIVKNGAGNSTIPSLNLNSIGNWNILQGYQVKATQATTLSVTGPKVQPENTPIPLVPGWQIIAYLRDNPQNTTSVFSTIQNQILLVKDNLGKTYIPQFGINTIGNMIPGQGYKVKALSAVNLQYAHNLNEDDPESKMPAQPVAMLAHFVIDSMLNTGNNSTLVVPTSAAATLVSGDEIGLFNSLGVLCGAAVYNSENLAVVVWGDDPSTANIVEGMVPNEGYKFRIWKHVEQIEYVAITTFSQGTGSYSVDGFDIVSSINLGQAVSTINLLNDNSLLIYPNPVDRDVFLSITDIDLSEYSVDLQSVNGETICQWSLYKADRLGGMYKIVLPSNTPSGIYIIKIFSNKTGAHLERKIVVAR